MIEAILETEATLEISVKQWILKRRKSRET